MSHRQTILTLTLALGLWLPLDGLASLTLLYAWLVTGAIVAAVRLPISAWHPSQRYPALLGLALLLAFLLTGLPNPRFFQVVGSLGLVVAGYLVFRDTIVRFDRLAPSVFAVLPATLVLHALQQVAFDSDGTIEAFVLTGGRFSDPSFGSPNSYGFALATATLAAGWAVERVERREAKVSVAVAAFLCVALLILTFSRGALLALLVGLTTMTVSRLSLRRLATVSALVGIVSMGFVVAFSFVPEAATRFTLGGDDSGSGRTFIWSILLSRLLDDPASLLTGFGAGSISFDLGWILLESAHNSYLDLTYMFGLVGLGALGWLLLSTLRGILRDADRNRRAMRLSAIAMLASAAFFDSHFGAVQVGWLVGLLIAVARWPIPLPAPIRAASVS